MAVLWKSVAVSDQKFAVFSHWFGREERGLTEKERGFYKLRENFNMFKSSFFLATFNLSIILWSCCVLANLNVQPLTISYEWVNLHFW